MRQHVHILVGIACWLLFAALWVELFVQHKATAVAFRDTAMWLGAVVGAVLVVTNWWVRHNVRIHRRKGPRTGRPSAPPRADADRLGRPVRWDIPGGVSRASAYRQLVVELDGDVKTYRGAALSVHWLASILSWAAHTPVYTVALSFVAAYPILTGVMWTLTALIFFRRNERHPVAPSGQELPFVSVVVPAYCEETVIEDTLDALLALDYPDYEIVVVDDGSPDRTAEIVRARLVEDGRLRLISKRVNEGKAMALNDAIPVTRGEIVVIVDADIRPRADILRHMVGHFRDGRVAAVAGNPQVANTRSLLAKVQATEFASIVSVLRRAQRVWGRILTVSGAICAFRKGAIVDVGLFDPDKVTEDIALSWKLQRRSYDIRYEPRAVCAMQVPETLSGLCKQRARWARGLAQVLRTHADVVLDWRARRLWPVFAEAVGSVLWAHCTVILIAFWALSYAAGLDPLGANPVPNFWGMVIATVALVQLGVGVWLDRHYNRSVGRLYLWAAMYPLFYWMLMLLITVVSTLPALLGRGRATSHWRTERVPVAEEAVTVYAEPAPLSRAA